MIELKVTSSSSIPFPTSSLNKKVFLDTDGVIKIMSFDGSIKSLESNKQELQISTPIVQQSSQIQKSNKKEFKELELNINNEIKMIREDMAVQIKKESDLLNDSIKKNKDYLKSNLDYMRVTQIDGGCLDD